MRLTVTFSILVALAFFYAWVAGPWVLNHLSLWTRAMLLSIALMVGVMCGIGSKKDQVARRAGSVSLCLLLAVVVYLAWMAEWRPREFDEPPAEPLWFRALILFPPFVVSYFLGRWCMDGKQPMVGGRWILREVVVALVMVSLFGITLGILKIADPISGADFTLQAHRHVYSVAFGPEGERIVSGGSGGVKVWNARTGEELLTIPGGGSRVAFSPDGQQVVSGIRGGSLKVWDARTGEERLTLTGQTAEGFNGVMSVAFSPDGKRIVSGHEDKIVKVWDAATGQQLFPLKGHTGMVRSVAYSPDGTHIVSGSNDETAKVWDARTGEERLTLTGHTGSILGVAFSPDGRRIVSVGNGTQKIWNARTGQEVLSIHGGYGPVAFSPDGKRLASGGGGPSGLKSNVSVWDSHTGEQLLTLEGHTDFVTGVAFSPDGERIVSASEDGTLKVWDANDGWGFLRWGLGW